MKRISEKKMIKWSVQENYTCYIQLVPQLKTIEITTSWYESKQQHTYEIGNDRHGKYKQKSLIFIVVPRVRVENKISRIS